MERRGRQPNELPTTPFHRPDAGANSYHDLSANGAAYYYEVQAVNAVGSSPVTLARLPGTSTVAPAALPAPAAASPLTLLDGGTNISVFWSDPHSVNSLVSRYVLERTDDGGATWRTAYAVDLPAFSTGADNSYDSVLAHVDQGVPRGLTYGYRLTSMNAGGSAVSSVYTLTLS